MIMISERDGFDQGADEIFAAKERGEKLFKADLARIMRTAVLAWNTAHPAPIATNTRPPRKKRASVARNELFDALASGVGSDPAALTKTAARTVAVALAEIKEVCTNLTVEEIAYRIMRYKQMHPTWPCTAMAICKNWADLGGGYRTQSGKADFYTEPNGWRPFAEKIAPELAKREWRDICVNYGRQIKASMP